MKTIEDNELHQLNTALENGHVVLKFPPELEKQYIRLHAENRLIISNVLLIIGISTFLLFAVLDYIVLPFPAAVSAWIIRGCAVTGVAALLYLNKRLGKKNIGYAVLSASIILINSAVVWIDIIGVNSTGDDLPIGIHHRPDFIPEIIIIPCQTIEYPG